MPAPSISYRIRESFQIRMSRWKARRIVSLASSPIVSFTFDDFPRTALTEGGRILHEHGVRGTYYTSFGLKGQPLPAGPAFIEEDIHELLTRGHELGCHTYSHSHPWHTPPHAFRQDILRNQNALRALVPSAQFATMSYPLSVPHPRNKKTAGEHYACCRGGGQSPNFGVADANYVHAYFLEKSGYNQSAVDQLIEMNQRGNGWLIFATHDIRPVPSRFGCTPQFFERIVESAIRSGARVMPVAAAWTTLTQNG